jgi:hypothetical protein
VLADTFDSAINLLLKKHSLKKSVISTPFFGTRKYSPASKTRTIKVTTTKHHSLHNLLSWLFDSTFDFWGLELEDLLEIMVKSCIVQSF